MNKIFALIPLALMTFTGCTMRGPALFASETERSFSGKTPEMVACYDNALKTDAKAAGTVTVSFVWQKKTGAFTELNVTGGTAPAALKACVTQNLIGLTLYPADSNDAKGTWTFTFDASSAAGLSILRRPGV